MKLTAQEELLLVGVGIALVAVYYIQKGASTAVSAVVDGAGAVAQAVNPINDQNIFNQGATAVFQKTTGSNDTIGGSIYNFFHGDAGDVATAPTNYKP